MLMMAHPHDGHDDGSTISSNTPMPTADSLPDDIASKIVAALPQEALRSLSETSHAWRTLSQRSVVSLQPRCMPTKEMCARHPNLTSLSLRRYQCLQACEINTLSGFSGLTELCLHGHAKLEDDVLGHITAALPALTSLNLSGCRKMTWPGLTQLSSLTNLQRLNCTGIKYVSGASLISLTDVLQRLRSLVMGDGCTLSYVDDELLRLIGSNASRLTSLDCSGCIDITDAGIEHLTRLAPLLTHFSLQSCVRVTQTGIASAVTALKSLTSLNLRGCMQLYDEGLSSLSVLTNLTSLSVQSCAGLKGPGFHALGNCTRLVNLNVRDCHFLSTLEGIANIKSLNQLSVARCTSLRPHNLAVISSLIALERLDASHLSMATRGAAGVAGQNSLHLESLSTLTALKELDLSHMRHAAGIPAGLLTAISHMTALTHLNMANMSAPALPASASSPAAGPPSTVPGSNQVKTQSVNQGACTAQLAFLSPLTQLRVLDLSGWQHTSPCALIHLSGLTQLTHLMLDRLGNSLLEACSTDKQAAAAAAAQADGEDIGEALEDTPRQHIRQSPPCVQCTCCAVQPASSAWSASQPQHSPPPLVTSASCASSLNMTYLEDHLAACGLHSEMSVTSEGLDTQALASSGTASQHASHSALVPSSLGVMDAGLCHLAGLKQLKQLSLQACVGVRDAGVTALQHLTALSDLNLGGCRHIQGAGLQHMAAGCQQLSRLVLENCTALCEPALMCALPHLNRLTCLNLAGCRALGDTTCEAVAAAGMCSLNRLSLRACDKITSRGATHLAHSSPSLANLDLANCWAVEDSGLLALAVHARRLTQVDLSYCWRLSADAVAEACQVNPLLDVQITHTCLSRATPANADSSNMGSSDEQLSEAETEESAVDGPMMDCLSSRRQPMLELDASMDAMDKLGACVPEESEVLIHDTWKVVTDAMYGNLQEVAPQLKGSD